MKPRKPKLHITLLTALFTLAGVPAGMHAGVVTNLVVLPVASSMTEGILASNVTVATFTDPGSVPIGSFKVARATLSPVVDDITNYTAVIDWGDGDTNGVGTMVPNGTGGLDVVGTHLYLDEGTNWVVVSISDVDGSVGSTTSEAIVADAPLCAHGTAVGAIEGILFTGQVATFRDKNVYAPEDDFTVTIDWGDESTSEGIVTALGAGQFSVSGGHTYAEESSYSVKVNIQDKGGSHASAGSTATVSDAPLTAAGMTIHPVESIAYNDVVATFSDGNKSAPISDFVVQITWGDGSAMTDGTVAMVEPGSFTVSGSHTYVEEGTFSVGILIVDKTSSGTNYATAGTTAQVGDAPLTADGTGITPVEGNSYTGVVATFTDKNPNATTNDFSANIDWGDGSPSSAGIISANGEGFDVTGTHTYLDEGSYDISVTILDVGGSTASAGSTATVSDAPLTANGVAVSGVEGLPFTAVVATLTDANPLADKTDFSALITWGDGSTSAGSIEPAVGGGFNISGTHTYAEEESYGITVDIVDSGGSLISAGTSATIADAPLSSIGRGISPVENTSFVAIVATMTDSNPNPAPNDFTASIDWGDGTSSSGTVLPTTVANQFDVLGSHTYAAEGLYTVLVTVNDVGGASTVATTLANTKDAPLVGTGTTVNAIKGVAFSGVVATCWDNDPTPELTNSMTALIDWGDGTTSAGSVIENEESGNYSVVGSHVYAQTGEYVVLATVDDSVNFRSTSIHSSAVITEAPAANVTAQLQIKATKPRLDKRTGHVKQVLTVKNVSGKPIAGPISVVFDNLQNGSGPIKLVNKDGQILTVAAAPVGSPYKNVAMPKKSNLLGKNGSKSITVYFDGGSTSVSYTTRVLAGTGAR